MGFANEVTESIDKTIVELAVLLHDVDDYKLVGREQANNLTNAREIMDSIGIIHETQLAVLDIIATMGYSKSLRDIRPTTIEGKIVSDADMCDAIGMSGVVRALVYALSSKGSGVIFDRAVWPITDITAEQYNSNGGSQGTDSFINHFFDKLLKIKDIMMTEPGRVEAEIRDKRMVSFLRGFFREEQALEWSEFFEKYIASR